MSFRRGWEVEYEDGSIKREDKHSWKNISKVGIIRLTLHYDGRRWDLHNKESYVQKKRGSVVPGDPDSFCVESRSIGYYQGNQKILFTVNEHTGQMRLEVKDT